MCNIIPIRRRLLLHDLSYQRFYSIYHTNQSDVSNTSDSAQNSWSVPVQNNFPRHQCVLVKDKYLNDLDYLDPNRIKEAFNDTSEWAWQSHRPLTQPAIFL